MVEECIDNGYSITNIIYSNDLLDIQGGKAFLDKIKDDGRLINVSNQLYREISNMETPQGILAIAKFEVNSICEANLGNNPLMLFLDRIQDPGNMGTIIRTADAFGIDGIVVTSGCVDIYNPKVVRATMGSIFRVPIYDEGDGIEAIKKIKDKGIATYVAALEESIYIGKVDLNRPCILVIGNESDGVSPDIMALADKLIKIPMLGGAESLNAAVASSIIMYEAIRQRTQ